MNLGRLLEFAAGRQPQAVAVVDGERRVTYGELLRDVFRLAGALRQLGVTRGDRIAALLRNRLEAVCLFWAAQVLGAVYAPLNPRMAQSGIQRCLTDVEPKLIFFDAWTENLVQRVQVEGKPLFVGVADPSAEEPAGGDVSYAELLQRGGEAAVWNCGEDDDIAVLLYTSGTTGLPKGVPRSHRNEYAATLAQIIQLRYQPGDSALAAMPLHHTMGLHTLLAMCMLNGKLVLAPDVRPAVSLDLVARERVSCLYLIPTLFNDLVKDPRAGSVDLSSVRKLGFAGAPMSEALVRDCQRLLQPEVFVNHYGSTEVYTYTTCPQVVEKPGCAGRPGIHQWLRLVVAKPLAGPDEEVAAGTVGQVIVHGSSAEAFRGYWNRPDLTRKVMRDGWYYTGDLGYFDDAGDLYLVGRMDEMVITGGEHVSPAQVEAVLLQHPLVQEAAVVGEPDDYWGQLVVAYVVARSTDLTAQALDQFCKSQWELAGAARPRKYVFVPELPKGPTGKVLRRELSRRYAGQANAAGPGTEPR
ncbi:MAG: acyl--CoA ligase [Alicyclobacillus sp.]|nr:acyl--CoA ligase [Alicyclobacillus sp.]